MFTGALGILQGAVNIEGKENRTQWNWKKIGSARKGRFVDLNLMTCKQQLVQVVRLEDQKCKFRVLETATVPLSRRF